MKHLIFACLTMKCPALTPYHTRIEGLLQGCLFQVQERSLRLVGPVNIPFHFLSEHCIEQWLRAQLSPVKLGLTPSSAIY